MASEIKANKISPATGTAFTIGDSGDTFTIPSGVTLTNNGTASGFGVSNVATSVYLSADQSTTKNVITKVQFDSEVYDPNGWFDNTTNYRFQPDQSGDYLVSTMLTISGTTSADFLGVYVYKNGSEIYGTSSNILDSTYQASEMLVITTSLNGSTDYLEIYGRSGANGTLLFETVPYNTASAKGCFAHFVRLT